MYNKNLMNTKLVTLVFKDGQEAQVVLTDYILDMWLTDKQTVKAISKFGKLKIDEEYLTEVNTEEFV